MKSQYRVVVIGGGVVGCSVLYHLAKLGWTDVMLIERAELTSGSSWHAAGGFHTLNGDPNVAKLQAYTVGLYKELEGISGQSCGLHLTGGVMLADTPERMDFLRLAHAKGRYLGMETEIITPSEAKAMFPLMDEKYFVGAMSDPVEGHLDPSGTTHAYAKAAQKLGAEIVLRNRVVELTQEPDGTWNVVTEQGTVQAEHVVNCGGLWAREVGRMVGLELPVLAMEHMYLLTETMPEVVDYNKERGRELIGVIDFKGEIYTRQERNGMLLGTYEKACKPWSPKHHAVGFRPRTAAAGPRPHRAVAGGRLPAFPGAGECRHQAGHQRPLHLRAGRQPAGRPGAGPDQLLVRLRRHGRLQPGRRRRPGAVATGWSTAIPASTSGAWTSPASANGRRCATPTPRCARTIRAASRSASPTRNCRPPGRSRPRRSTTSWWRKDAVMGDSWGLETPLWFAPKGERAEGRALLPPLQRFRRMWARRCGHARGRRRHRDRQLRQVRGAPARARRPSSIALMTNTHAEDRPHRADADAERARQADRRLHHRQGRRRDASDLGLVAGAEIPHALVRAASAEATARLRIHRLGMRLVGLSIAGPKSREVLQALTDEDVSNAAFRFMDLREMDVGGVPGDGQPRHLYRRSRLRDLGGAGLPAPPLPGDHEGAARRTALSISACARCSRMRLEKNFPTWFRELRPIYGALRGRHGPLRRPGRRTTSSAARRPAEKAGGGDAAARLVHRRCGRCRRDGRRADLARRQGGRLGHVGRLRPLRRQVAGAGLRAEGTCRRHRSRAHSRSRSSASSARLPSSPNRCSTPRASACGGEGRPSLHKGMDSPHPSASPTPSP